MTTAHGLVRTGVTSHLAAAKTGLVLSSTGYTLNGAVG